MDSMIPISRGQRELIIRDRQTGKTTVAIDTILNQRAICFHSVRETVYCIYGAIGQKKLSVTHLMRHLKRKDTHKYSVIVIVTASDYTLLPYLTPYT